jgi:hypothetical protein
VSKRPICGTLLVLTALLAAAPAASETKPGYGNITLNTGVNPAAAKIADLDGDGRNDIAVVTLQGSLQLFYNSRTMHGTE